MIPLKCFTASCYSCHEDISDDDYVEAYTYTYNSFSDLNINSTNKKNKEYGQDYVAGVMSGLDLTHPLDRPNGTNTDDSSSAVGEEGEDENKDVETKKKNTKKVNPKPSGQKIDLTDEYDYEEPKDTPTEIGEEECVCGRNDLEDPNGNGQRIVGGKEAIRNSHPWQVGLEIWAPGATDYYFCGGTLLTRHHVLSAAHCIFDNIEDSVDADPTLSQVVIGAHEFEGTEGQRIKIKKAIFPPGQIGKITLKKQPDAVLLVLTEAVKFSSKVVPICLPLIKKTGETQEETQDYNEADTSDASSCNSSVICENIQKLKVTTKSYSGETVTVTGWGGTDAVEGEDYKRRRRKRQALEALREAKVNTINNTYCEKLNNKWITVLPIHLCTSATNGIDPCQGDSGGPATIKEHGRYTQVGIISVGKGCADPRYAGVMTRVTKILGWLTDTITKDTMWTSDCKKLQHTNRL